MIKGFRLIQQVNFDKYDQFFLKHQYRDVIDSFESDYQDYQESEKDADYRADVKKMLGHF